MKQSRKVKVWADLAFFLLAILLALFLFTDENIEIVRTVFSKDLEGTAAQDQLRELGFRGYMTISILSMLQVIIPFLPSEPVQILGGASFGFLHATVLCTIGVVVGNTIIYILYRFYGERLATYFDKKINLDTSSESTIAKMTLVVFILYFLPAIPYGMICFFAATMGLKYPRYITVTTLGSIPSILIGVGLGHMAVVSSWVLAVCILGGLIILLGIAVWKKDFLMEKLNVFIHKIRGKKSEQNSPIATDVQGEEESRE